MDAITLRHNILNQIQNVVDLSNRITGKYIFTGGNLGAQVELRNSSASDVISNAAQIKTGATYVVVTKVLNPLSTNGRGLLITDVSGKVLQKVPDALFYYQNIINKVKFKSNCDGYLWVTIDKNMTYLGIYTY